MPKFPDSAARRREQIFAATVALLLEHGLHGVQTRSVTERAGVATGLLHHHFAWPELRAAAWAAIFEGTARDIRHDGEVPQEAIERFFANAFAPAARPFWRLWLEAEDLAATDPAMRAALGTAQAALREALVGLLEAGCACGAWRLDAPAATALRLEALRDGLAGMLLSGAPGVEPASAEAHLRRLFALEQQGPSGASGQRRAAITPARESPPPPARRPRSPPHPRSS
jgi:AcrR family transcriptional regulator